MTARIDKTEFKPLEPIKLSVRAQSASNGYTPMSAVGLPPEAYYRVFRVKVFDGKGDLLPKTRYHQIDVPTRGLQIGGSTGSGALAPGREIQGEVIANLVYDMSSPGDYTILIEFPTGEVRMIDGQPVPVVSQTKEIRVRVIAEPPFLPALKGN